MGYKHEWVRGSDGEIDVWKLEYEYHNGPKCIRCEGYFCEHCEPKIYEEDCPNQDPYLF